MDLDGFLANLSQSMTYVTADSRRVTPGALFVAVPGGIFDGHDFIPQAIEKGAIAVVGSRTDLSFGVPYLPVSSPRLALS